jgi:hypothetical protein
MGAPLTRALVAAYLQYASLGPWYPSARMGDAALDLDLFEQPAEKKRVPQ